MRRAPAVALIAAWFVGIAALGGATAASAGTEPPTLTPVVVTPLSDEPLVPVVGTDSLLHVVYELQIVNPRAAPVPIDRVEVRSPSPRLKAATFEGDELTARLRRLDGTPVPAPVVDPGAQLFLLVDVALPSIGPRTRFLEHVVTVGDQSFTTAPVALVKPTPTVLAPPVAGSSWVVTDGCCRPEAAHRANILPTSDGFSVPARYAIDLRQMDEQGHFVVGDPAQPTSYPGYGTYVYAVAPGVVVDAVDEFPDAVPGAAPESAVATSDLVRDGGNSVVILLRDGTYAAYEHLQAGSVIVKVGAHVRRGQPIAKLGNSGDSTTPHLGFHLMTGPSGVGADGLPFALAAFGYAGQIDRERLAVQGLTGEYADNRRPVAQTRERQLPLDLAIVDFDASSGTSGSPLV